MASLDPLIRLNKHKLEERQKRIAMLLKKQAEYEAEKKQLFDDMQAEVAQAENSHDLLTLQMLNGYTGGVQKRMKHLDKLIADLDTRLDIFREALREDFIELKKAEIVRDNRANVEAKKAAKIEADAMDEIGLGRYMREEV